MYRVSPVSGKDTLGSQKKKHKVTGTVGAKERWQSPELALEQNNLGEEGKWIDVS